MSDENYNQVRWHCRRGMLELDILLHGYFDAKYADLSEAQQGVFKGLLEWPDQSLWRCIFSGEETPDTPQQQALITDIITHHKQMRDDVRGV